MERAREDVDKIIVEVERAIVGKREVLELVLMGVLAGGHVLLEDVPGLAKTLMARSFATALGLDFSRIQFTPDLLPADITGSSIFDQRNHRFDFRQGPLFTNLLLGDEINRAPPKTQAALLEAMQEGQVTVDELTHALPAPFIVMATQNPIEYEGTYPLPEAQLDRFILRASVGYPERDLEWEILRRRIERRSEQVELKAVVARERLLELQRVLEDVYVGESVGLYIIDIAKQTRAHPDTEVGASPRGGLALMKLARGKAFLEGRDFVTPDDVKAVGVPALAHRLSLRPHLWVRERGGVEVVEEVLQTVPAPPAEPGPSRA